MYAQSNHTGAYMWTVHYSFISIDYKWILTFKISDCCSWWTVAKHLCWSLLGIVELDPLDSSDELSVTVVRFLYGGFMIMGAVLLMNMMIALLSNTYQRVEVIISFYFGMIYLIVCFTRIALHPHTLRYLCSTFRCISWEMVLVPWFLVLSWNSLWSRAINGSFEKIGWEGTSVSG